MTSKRKGLIKIYLLGIVISLLLLSCLSSQIAFPISSLTATPRHSCLVYAGPDEDYYTIGRLALGSRITLVGRHGDWVTFTYEGNSGWVQAGFLNIDGDYQILPEISDVRVPPPPEPTNTLARPTNTSSLVRAIDWRDAGDYLGQVVTICGPVVNAYYANQSPGSPTFFDIGEAYPSPDRFSVVIWGEYRSSFPFAPETYFLGRTICVYGEVEQYQGIYQIEALPGYIYTP